MKHTLIKKVTQLPRTIKSFLIVFLAFILGLTAPIPIHALTNAEWEFYGANGIYWYDPNGSLSSFCYVGDITVSGSTAEEKIWNALRTFLSPEVTAGLMGNLKHESGLNPARYNNEAFNRMKNMSPQEIESKLFGSEGFAVGLVQWYTAGRRNGVMNSIKQQNPNLIQYFTNIKQYGHLSGEEFLQAAGDTAFNQLVQIESEYIKTEFNTNFKKYNISGASTVEEATNIILRKYEVPIADKPENEAAIQTEYRKRLASAQEYYNKYKNLTPSNATLSGSAGSSSSSNLSSITIIGNSLINGLQPFLEKKLNDTNKEIAYEAGNFFTDNPLAQSTGMETGKDVIKRLKDSGELRKNVVYALGANDAKQEGNKLVPTITKSDIDEVINLVGKDRNLYFLTVYTKNIDFSNVNNLLKQAANSHSNVHIIDYASVVSGHPEYFEHNTLDGGNDGIHLNEDGYTAFAKKVAATLGNIKTNTVSGTAGSNFTADGCTYTGDFQKTVQAYAWPEYHKAVYVTPTTEYKKAVDRRIAEGKYVGGNQYKGIDCGGFVTTLMQDSGFAPDYNSAKGSTGTQESWVKSKGWTLLNTNEQTPVSTTILQPGDVAFVTGHTFVYIGDVPGFQTKIASASLDERAPMSGKESLVKDGDRNEIVRWYRKP